MNIFTPFSVPTILVPAMPFTQQQLVLINQSVQLHDQAVLLNLVWSILLLTCTFFILRKILVITGITNTRSWLIFKFIAGRIGTFLAFALLIKTGLSSTSVAR